MTDYASNSDKNKAPLRPDKTDKQIEKVVTVEVIQKPKPLGRKFKDIFLGGDAKTAARYVAADVLLPALRNLIFDVISKGADRVIFGESSYRRGRSVDYRPRIQYNNPINRPSWTDPRERRVHLPDQSPRMPRRDQNDIILSDRGEAEIVVERLIDIIDKYEIASVADLYDLLGLPTSHIDNKWGWTYLNNIEIRQVREGYLINLPDAEPI